MKKYYIIFLIVALFLISSCNRGDSTTGKIVKEVEPVIEEPKAPDIIKEESKKEETKPIEKSKIEPEALEAHFIDVGYGDAILFKEGKNVVLVDCGRTDDAIYNYLKEQNINDIDLLITTVPTKEHIGGCDRVLRNFNVANVMDNGRSPDTKEYKDYDEYSRKERYNFAKKGDQIKVGDIKISILASNNRIEQDNSNVVVMKVSYGDVDFLLASDCDRECESRLPVGLQSEIFKVASHGSLVSNSYEFISKISPEVSIITVNVDNKYSNPKQQVLDRLSQSEIYRTDLHGTIIVKTDGKKYSVKTEKQV